MGRLVPTGADMDRETLLDISVNIIPIGILLFFIVLFLVYDPFTPNAFLFAISHALTIIPLVLLALLTYVSAKVISRDERELEARSRESSPATVESESEVEAETDAETDAGAATEADAEASAEADAEAETGTEAEANPEPGDEGRR